MVLLIVIQGIVIGLTGFLLGLIFFLFLAVIEFGAWALVAPARARKDGVALSESPGDFEPISVVVHDGARLSGRWYPALGASGTGRTVLLLHGFAEGSSSIQSIRVKVLNEAGWNAASMDLRGYGESGGQFASFGGREAQDIQEWLDSLTGKLGGEVPLRPVLWGRSMGAAIAVRAAAKDSRVRGLILESPMIDLDNAMTVWFRRRRAPLPRLLARLVTGRATRIAGVSLTRPRPMDVASKIRCPVLILHGTDDSLISIPEVQEFATAFPIRHRLIEIPGAGHSDVMEIGADWLMQEVKAFLDSIAAET